MTLIEEAKSLLRNNGYVVIPKDRRVVLTVSRTISHHLVDNMKPDELARVQQHCYDAAALQLGRALQDSKAIITVDKGLHEYGQHIEYQMAYIKPREDGDKR